MKSAHMRRLLAVLCMGLVASAFGRPALPPAPAQPPAPAADLPGGERGNWRNLSPAQRDAIRRLSREQREALINRRQGRQGDAAAPAGRLTPEERRQLRAQIREDHERRGGRFGGGRRF